MVKRAKNFDELCENRKKWVEISKDNDFDEGILKLLTELYPDKAHFVYELLQNAEDAKATKVSFKLYKDRLEFVHNGSRLFSLDDIDSITSIANTTKTKEDHSIGKFGVGFKAVFSYTKTPQIHSGEWSFEIDNLVVPTPIKPLKEFDSNKTYFIFPFNNPKKTSDKAYAETADGLRKLKPETLLFLNNIQELSYEINKECYRIYKNEEEHIVSLYQDKQTTPIAKYLRFVKDNIQLETSNGLMKKLSVALAYKLEEDKDERLKIVPIKSSERNVYIYFPAEKEDSKLRFLINAPFDSEVSRASIRDTDDNALLINEIVNLQIETMEYLRDNGYLTTEFLGVLPNSQDGLWSMYKVFHTKLLELFNTEDYTPTMSGKFRPATKLFKGSAMYTNGPHISEFISEKELVKLCGKYDMKPPLWVKNTLQNSLADYFMQDLDLREFGVEEFYNWLSFIENDDDDKEIWQDIVDKKEFNDLVKLYRMLYQYFEENYETADDFNSIPLFRCTDGKMYSNDDKVYILPEDDIPEDMLSSYHFIDKKSFGTSRQRDYVRNLFTKYFNIEEFSEKAICEEMLKKYDPDSEVKDIPITEHIQDIKLLLKHYDEFGLEFCKKLENLPFILTSDKEYVLVRQVYSDQRYGNKHDLLKEVKDIIGLSEISIAYKEKLGSKQVEKFISILNDLGIHKFLWINKYNNNKNNPLRYKLYSVYNWSHITGISKDYGIYGLDEIIRAANERKISWSNVSKLIWMSIFDIEQPENYVDSCYRANQRDSYHQVPATFIQILSKSSWILTRDGSLQKPKDVTFEDLPDNWIRPKSYYEHPILKAIGFGKNSQKQREEQIRKDQTAQAAGFENAKEAEELKKLRDEMTEAGITTDEMRSYIQRKQEKNNKQLPEAESKNPERRQEKILQENESADEQTYEIRERSVRTTDTQVRKDARQYLTDMYTDEDGEMCCQMCQEELPFKKKDGQYCFETKEIFNKMEKEDKHQYLALCPNCAAEYDEWVKKDEKTSEMLKNKIAERKYMKGEKSVSMDFYIHDDLKTLYFTGKHYLDMRTVVCPDADIDENQSFWASLGGNVVIPLEVGDTVRSEHFGEGKVQNIEKDTIVVNFKENGIKKVNINYLEKKMS